MTDETDADAAAGDAPAEDEAVAAEDDLEDDDVAEDDGPAVDDVADVADDDPAVDDVADVADDDPAEDVGEDRPADSLVVRAAQLFGLCGFAFAYPLFAILATGATFFVAHGADRGTMLLFATVVLLGPPLLLATLVQLVALVSHRAARWAMAGLFGLLVAITVVSAVDRAATLTVSAYVLGALLLAAVAAWGYARLAAVRSFATFLSPAPLLFLVSFLLLSPVSALVVDQDPSAAVDTNSRRTPVVMVIFDELPLGMLLTPDGEIDAARFPGFARLASVSTWYPGATSVAPATHLAVPSLLTGTLADTDDLPVAASYPRSLFTMLQSTHELEVHESVTRLCPAASCEAEEDPPATGALTRDSVVVLGHQLLPAGLAGRWLPDIGGSWSDFGADTDLAAAEVPTDGADLDDEEWRDLMMADGREDHRDDFDALLASIDGPSPVLWYEHELLPHLPVKYLPDGTEYDRIGHPEGMVDSGRFGPDADGTAALRQRFLLQVTYVDHQLEQLLDRLDVQGVLDPAMVVVAADHGISFEPGGDRRAGTGLTDVNRDEVLPVPLFIKYPGQQAGEVDRRPAQTVDVLPTIADELDVQLPDEWRFDGSSLSAAGGADEAHPRWWVPPSGEVEQIDQAPDPTAMAAVTQQLFGPGGTPHDLYGLGPHGDLVGRPVAPLLGPPQPGVLVQATGTWADGRASTEAPLFPAFLQANVLGLAPGTPVAVAVDGHVAGTGTVFDGRNGVVVEIMLDPDLFADGTNEIELYAVEGEAGSEAPVLRPLALAD